MPTPPSPDFSPAAERNKQPILAVLQALLPAQGKALEIASGTGQHVAWFAAGLPQWVWQPTDAQAGGFGSIAAWVAQAGLTNVHAPVVLDVMADVWLVNHDVQVSDEAAKFELTQLNRPKFELTKFNRLKFDLIYCANMLHISPWATCAALMQGSARHLATGGQLVIYGPYLEDEVDTSAGNLSFNQSLRQQNPAWGIRRLEDVAQVAHNAGLQLVARHALPANNLLLVWEQCESSRVDNAISH